MNKTGIIGGILEELETTIGQVGQQVKSVPKAVGQTVASQTGVAPGTPVSGQQAGDINKEVVKSLYAKSDPKAGQNVPPQPPQASAPSDSQASPQSPEEAAKLAEARQKLQAHQKQHKETYYDPLVNPPKREEERPAEKVEKEEEQEEAKEMELEQKKQKGDQDIAATRARERVERPPGAG